jgi:hypothetical protein
MQYSNFKKITDVKQIIFYCIALFFVAVSCTDLTEEVFDSIPSENYPETPEQLGVAHLDAYSQFRHLFDDNGYWFLTQLISSDEVVAPRRAQHWFDGGKWLQLQYHSWNDESDAVVAMWRDIYVGVQKSNQVLDNLRASGVLPIDKISEVEAMRSFYFYMLMDNYGDIVYQTYSFGADPFPYRTRREVVFDSLVNTLERGLKYLPSISLPAYKDFASKEMAQALLVKLYLNHKVYKEVEDMSLYTKAIAYSDSLINNPSLSLEADPLAPFKVANTNSSEVIFKMPFDDVNNLGFRLHMRSLHYNHNETFDMGAGPWNGFCVIPDHFDTYEDRDARKEGFFIWGPQYTFDGSELIVDNAQLDIEPYIPYANMDTAGPGLTSGDIASVGARIGKYEIYQGALENLNVNLPIFRLPDVILMKAEAELRSGSLSAETLNLVNQIRTRAGIDAWGLTDVNLDSIYAERGRELFAEGHKRNDMIRFGKFDQNFWCKGDGTDPLDPGANDIENIFPIPLEARTTNPNLDAEPN